MLKVGLVGLLLRGWTSLQPVSKTVFAPLALKKKTRFEKKQKKTQKSCHLLFTFHFISHTSTNGGRNLPRCAIPCERPFVRQRIPPHMACVLSSPPLKGAIQASIQAKVAAALQLSLPLSFFLSFLSPLVQSGFSATLHAKVTPPPLPSPRLSVQ